MFNMASFFRLMSVSLSFFVTNGYANIQDHIRTLENGQVEAFYVKDFPIVNGKRMLKGVTQKFNTQEEAESFVVSNVGYEGTIDIHHLISSTEREVPDILNSVQSFLDGEQKNGILFHTIENNLFSFRLKAFDSFKTKLFERINKSNDPNAGRRAGPINYVHTFGDVFGVRILVRDDHNVKQLVDNIKASGNFNVLDVRTIDGISYFLNVKTRASGAFGFDGSYEIQIWPFTSGLWMLWQGPLIYKKTLSGGEYLNKLRFYRDQKCHEARVLGSAKFLNQISLLPEGKKVGEARRILAESGLQILREIYVDAVDYKFLRATNLEDQNGIVYTGFEEKDIAPKDRIDLVQIAYDSGLFNNANCVR